MTRARGVRGVAFAMRQVLIARSAIRKYLHRVILRAGSAEWRSVRGPEGRVISLVKG